MRKILSLTSNDFLSGISEYPYTSNHGLWTSTGGRFNPYSRPGTIQPASVATNLTGSAVVDLIQSFVQNNEDIYGMGESGNFYKIESFFSTGTVSNLRAGSTFTNPAIGLEIFETKVGATRKAYYWRGAATGTGYIGEYNLATTWNDTKYAISDTYPSANHPIYRIDDTIFFGSGYVLSKIYDDGANADPALLENILDLPKDHNIVSLETDGTYLIIVANITNSKESKVYFWDYKNKSDSWTVEYTIRDVVGQLRTIAGITYAVALNGFYAFNSVTEPKKLRRDIKNGKYQAMHKFNDGLIIGRSVSGTATYGNILPGLKTGVFTPYITSPINAMIVPSYTNFFIMYYSYLDSATPVLYKQNLLDQPSSAATSQIFNASTSAIDLGSSYIIKRMDIIFADKLSTGQEIANVFIDGSSLGTSVTFNDPKFSDYGAVTRCELYPTNGELVTDILNISISDNSGSMTSNSIKRIDIYGEPSIK